MLKLIMFFYLRGRGEVALNLLYKSYTLKSVEIDFLKKKKKKRNLSELSYFVWVFPICKYAKFTLIRV